MIDLACSDRAYYLLLYVVQVPSGSNEEALKHVSLNAMKNAKKVYNNGLDHQCTWRYYHGIFLPVVLSSYCTARQMTGCF